MSLSPQVCKKSYKVKIPTLGENCEFWLITVTDESGITNPNKDHAYLTDSGKLYIYNGKTLIQVNCDICFTQEERDKLEGIEEGANKYALPVASSTELGGVLLGYTQDGRNYPVLKDEDGRIYVQVPWIEYSLPIAKDDTLGGIKTGYDQNGRFYPVLVDVDGNAYVNVPWTDTDTKYNVVSTTENGLAPMLPTENADKKFLNGDGEWVEVNESINGNTITGSTFSGETSDCGVQILEVQGKTVQNGTPSPDSPVPIENVKITEITSHGRQLFDASKIATKTQGGATITNNGDGSFTISGNGTLSEIFEERYVLSNEETKRLFRTGKVYMKDSINKNGFYLEAQFLISSGNKYLRNNNYIELTEDTISDVTCIVKIYAETGTTIPNTTIKPMIYQDGDGTWEPFRENTVETNLTLAEGDTYENGQITRVRKQITLDGSSDELWGNIDSQNGYGRFYINLPNAPVLNAENIENILSNIFEIKNNISYWNNPSENCISYIASSEKGRIGVVFDGATDLTSFKSWLSTHNLVVEYELETPTTEELKVPTIPSYDPYTEISTNSVVDPTITFRPLPFTTCLVGEATEEESGYMPPLSGNSNEFLNGNGEWSVPSGYTLPTASSTVLGGVKIGSNITVSSGTISLTKANVVSALGYTPPTTNTTYALATTSASGLLRQLNGNTSQFLNGNGQWATPPNTTYGVATTSSNGLMSSTDKSRLDQLWAKFDSMVFFTED